MRILILIGLLLNVCSMSFGQKDISGVYKNNSGWEIIIDDSEFIYIAPYMGANVLFFYNDTLAHCTYKRINKEFIEVNSINDNIGVSVATKVTQSKTLDPIDSIRIKFIIPYDRDKLDIAVYGSPGRCKFEYSQKSQELSISSNTSKISFAIEPRKVSPHDDFDGRYYGRIYYYNWWEYEIESGVNNIEIEIPTMTNSFFEEYYLKGEYVRIVGNKIKWQGETYKKCRKTSEERCVTSR